MKRLKKGDDVIVIAGRDKGKRGKLMRVLDNDRCIVEGVQMVKKHVRPDPNKGERGGIISKEATIHASNIMPYNATTGKGDRVGSKVIDGKRTRYFKSNDQVIDN